MFVLVFAAACDTGGREDPPPDDTGTGPEFALATNAETTIEETTSVLDQYADEATSENTAGDEQDTVVRLEGEEDTRFTGICSFGDERNVLSGEVPRRFEFRLGGEKLSCVIQKRTSSGGSLRVVLVSGGKTRSVQQTEKVGGEVRISFSSDPA